MSTAGTVLDGTPLSARSADSTLGPADPAFSCVPGLCLLVWDDRPSEYVLRWDDVKAARIHAGAVLDPEGFIVSLAGSISPSCVSDNPYCSRSSAR